MCQKGVSINTNYVLLKKENGKWTRLYGPSSYGACQKELTRIIEARVVNCGDRVLENRESYVTMTSMILVIKEVD